MKNNVYFALCSLILTLFIVRSQAQDLSAVKIWEEELVLPTYLVDEPEKAPMFFEHDSYQGASRIIYPYPLEDDFTGKKGVRTYKAVYIENEYLKVCILPEIGGRLFYATDKTNDYEIFYRQHVIKPAHIGMLGAWISGGIEFCVFHHHRATTNMPVDYHLEENEDGSATLWIGETELRHRMKWTFGISLYPGKSFLELDGRIINNTENANSFLYWANVATSVNDDYQIIFPPSTEFTVFHAKNSFAHWPITKEAYRGNKFYENNIDASWWKNHPGQNSFFAHEIKEGFLAGYDHGKQAGTMLVGNPHIVKGAKLWEWGKGSYWDTQVLTDDDGPYAEVMSGAYSDNQPDYSWIKPYEYKTFKQYWYPMRESRGAVTANLHGLLNMSAIAEDQLYLSANTTYQLDNATIRLTKEEETIFEKQIHISPSSPFQTDLPFSNAKDQEGLILELVDEKGNSVLSYSPQSGSSDNPLPEAVKPPLPPEEISSNEELYFTGLRIKQFHNARINAIDYFKEALKRDPLDSRSNTQMGIYYREMGAFELAADYLRKALIRPTHNYTRPRNCEPFYQLGLALIATEQYEAAYDTLYRAAWDHAFASPAYLELARISSMKGNDDQALIEIERSLQNNATNLAAMQLKATLLRHKGEHMKALLEVNNILAKDKLYFPAWVEFHLLKGEPLKQAKLSQLLRDYPESYLELAIAYLKGGFLEEAEQILSLATESSSSFLANYPTIHYYLGYISHLKGKPKLAQPHFEQAQEKSIDYCFPFRFETIKVYEQALEYNPQDAKAYYFLGNLLFDKQADVAIESWESAVKLDPSLAMAHRNLGWGYFRHEGALEKAIAAYEKAIAIDNGQFRFFEELDRLYEQNGTAIDKRYELISQHAEVFEQHARTLTRAAMVSNAFGDYDRAVTILTQHYFNRQEGFSGLHDLYVDAMLLRGIKHLDQQNWELAKKDFQAADLYPENHSIGKNEKSQRRAQIFYFMGQVEEKSGKRKKAKTWYRKATSVEVEDAEYKYHLALAFQRLGEKEKAEKIFSEIQAAGEQLLAKSQEVDFFSKFGGEDQTRKRKSNGHFLLGLSHLGDKNRKGSLEEFEKSVTLNPGHAWASYFVKEIQ